MSSISSFLNELDLVDSRIFDRAEKSCSSGSLKDMETNCFSEDLALLLLIFMISSRLWSSGYAKLEGSKSITLSEIFFCLT